MAAKGSICYGAKEVLEREMRTNAVPFSPIVLTSDQEDYMKNRKVYWNTNYKLWKLKSNQPHLFANIERWRHGEGGSYPNSQAGPPPGFEQVGEGWLLHKERQIFMEEASHRCLWLDGACGVYREVVGGEDVTSELALSAGASTSSSSRAPAAGKAPAAPASASSAAPAPARNLAITDLHKAADVFKLDIGHLDRPAAMLALYKHAEGALPPDVAAKCVHERLLKRLAANRGAWPDETLQALLVDVLSTVAAEHKAAAGVAGAVALVLGQRLVATASHGATCAIADALPGDMKDVRCVATGTGAALRVACVRLDPRSASCVFLHTDAIDEHSARRSASHAESGRPRAGAVALLQASDQAEAAKAPTCHAAACLHLSWLGADSPGGDGAPAPKRARLDEPRPASVRCRQVLLKYAGCRQPTDSVRRKPVRRSQAEAEAGALAVLVALEEARSAGGAAAEEAAFTKQVRAVSECQSSLKGGDLAGDIGWLKLPEIKPGEKISKEQAQRMIIVKAALGLAVHEVSDILVSDDGVHLLKRAA